MAQVKNNRAFMQEAVAGMTKEEFDEFVKIVLRYYWKYQEAVIVDGANDGGCDIKVYQNKREVKKCVQITIQKTQIEAKIKSDLKKVSEMISQYGYSNKFDFYYSKSLSQEKVEEYKKFAIDEYDIDLDIFEAKRLSQLACAEAIEYIYSLHEGVIVKPDQMNIDRATETMYDLLAHGKESSDIKNSLVDSVIISIIYQKAPIGVPELETELEKRIGKDLPDILHSVNTLKSDQRVKKDEGNNKLLRLSDDEYTNVQEILALSAKNEKDFYTDSAAILTKYGIDYQPKILDELTKLYKHYYTNDIDNRVKDDEAANVRIFERFKKYLLELLPQKGKIDLLIKDIQELCTDNAYLNKVSASKSIISLYKSKRLELYLNQRQKDIYLDTPTFIYLLCAYYGIDRNDWDNPYYRSMKSLIKLKDTYSDKVHFYIIRDYLGEVVGEIQKALQYAKFEKYSFFKELGGTTNKLYNYYRYLKDSELFEVGDHIESFEDFVYSLGLDNTDPNSDSFLNDALCFLQDVTENYSIEVVGWTPDDRHLEIKNMYEKILYMKHKEKSDRAICNDVNQVITSMLDDSDADVYFTTWDTTIHLLRDKILNTISQGRYHYFNIYTPARLSNKIALENFNIDESALTSEIFAYADKRYDISNRVKSLLEIIAPFIKGDGGNKLLRKLGRLRKEQLEDHNPMAENVNEDKNLPIEEIVTLLIPNKERIKQDSKILVKFSHFMSIEENADYIIHIISEASKLKDYKSFDFSEYFGRIGSVDLSLEVKDK